MTIDCAEKQLFNGGSTFNINCRQIDGKCFYYKIKY